MKLSVKINLFISLMVLVAVLVLGYFVTVLVRTDLEKTIGERQLNQNRTLIEEMDEILYDRGRDIVSISKTHNSVDALSTKEFISELDQELDRDLNGVWDEIVVVDKNGNIVGQTNRDKIKHQDISVQPEMKIAFEKSIRGEDYYSDLVRSTLNGTPTIIFSSPVKDISGNHPIIGVVIGQLNWSSVSQILEKDSKIIMHLYNKNGDVIGDNESDGHILSFNHSDQKIVKDALSGTPFSIVAPSVHGQFTSLTTGTFEPGFGTYKGNGWALILETPVSVAYAPISSNIYQLLGAIILTAIFGMAGGLFINQYYVIKPISKLTEAAKIFSGGDLSFRIKSISSDEIGDLGKSFNDMAEKLKASHENLQQKVDSKTHELSLQLKEVERANIELDNAKKAITNVTEDIYFEKEKLEETKAKEDAILNSIGEGMFVADLEGKVVLVNKMFETLTGWSASEVFGKRFVDVVPLVDPDGNQIPVPERPIMVSIETGKTVSLGIEKDYFFIKKDGTKLPVSVKTAPVIQAGKTIGAVNVFRDVTQEKAIDKMKTEFLSVAAHQLRTPLGSMRWDLEMLLSGDYGELTADIKTPIQQIHTRNLHMIGLVNDLLNVSRIDQGKVLDEPKMSDLGAIVKNVAGDLKPLLSQKSITINLSIGESEETFIDPKKFHQVMENLITNSINYSHQGGTVEVKLQQMDGYIKVDVIDSGIGIPEDDKKRIFDKFFRAENAIKSETDGTGLGLFVVKSYIDLWKGKIWFESTEGKGTTFCLQIPIIKENVNEKNPNS